MASTDLHVNGPAFIQVAIDGSSYNAFGVTVDGPDIEEDGNFENVYADDLGPFLPTDVQYFGQLATIRTEMMRWDESVLRQILGRIRARAGGNYVSNDIGTLLIAGNQYIGLQYASSARTGLPREQGRRYPCCFPVGAVPFKPGTRVTRYTITFAAIVNPAVGVLYQNVAV